MIVSGVRSGVAPVLSVLGATMTGMDIDPVLPAPAAVAACGRRAPTQRPMTRWRRGLVAVADTNALASRACRAVRDGQPTERLFTSLALTGRSPVFVAPHVVVELVNRLPEIAESNKVPLVAAEAMLWESVMAEVRVVELGIGDHLAPRARRLLSVDPDLPLRLRGDPDDLPTAALAEFLAPAVILSADSVFTRFGLSDTTAATWVSAANRLLEAADVEALVGDAEALGEFAAELALVGMQALARAARRHPLLAAGLLGSAAIVAARAGQLRAEPWQSRGRALAMRLSPLADEAAAALERHTLARGRLHVIEASSAPTVSQLAARHLARRIQAITPSELRDELCGFGHRVPATRLKAAMTAHPAFVRLPGDRYTVGRPVDPQLVASLLDGPA